MIGKFIVDSLKKEEPFRVKVKTFIHYFKFYRNLSAGLKSKEIYHEKESQDKKFKELLLEFDENDWNLIETIQNENIVKFLQKNQLSKILDFDKKNGFDQVGINTIFVGKPVVGLWTTGKATFFLPTNNNSRNNLLIEITSVPPVNVTIGFDGKIVKKIKMPKLTTKIIEIKISSKDIKKTISEIFILADKLWYPKIVLGTRESILVGIKVNKIKISY